MASSNLTEEYREFLDELQASGEVNMFGAGRYLQEEFGLDKYEAKDIVLDWIDEIERSN